MTSCPSEDFECVRFVSYLRAQNLRFTHVPNSTNSRRQGVKNKRLGVSPGVPDYFVLAPKGLIFVEMKKRSGGRVSKEQREWLACLTEAGVPVRVCKGFDEAKRFVEENS